jgi:hypothetical protein
MKDARISDQLHRIDVRDLRDVVSDPPLIIELCPGLKPITVADEPPLDQVSNG